ncbi:MAG: aldo/keto reductase, partial [Lachnospiraceae bacterium]|nr:aldo/keto reductase [Lachnospiraceae bacterium]
VAIIPKSSNEERMKQNLDIWDFKLTEEEMNSISKKDLGHSEIINHFDVGTVKMIMDMKIH